MSKLQLTFSIIISIALYLLFYFVVLVEVGSPLLANFVFAFVIGIVVAVVMNNLFGNNHK